MRKLVLTTLIVLLISSCGRLTPPPIEADADQDCSPLPCTFMTYRGQLRGELWPWHSGRLSLSVTITLKSDWYGAVSEEWVYPGDPRVEGAVLEITMSVDRGCIAFTSRHWEVPYSSNFTVDQEIPAVRFVHDFRYGESVCYGSEYDVKARTRFADGSYSPQITLRKTAY
jgi:hypothetical protein